MLMPKPIVDKIVDKSVEFVPVVGSVASFSRKAKKVTKLSNPITATTRGIGLVVIICTGPVIKYPALCAAMGASFALSIISGSPILFAAGVDFGEQLLEEL